MSLRELWLLYRAKKLAGGSASSIAQFVFSLDKFERFVQHPAALADLTNENLEGAMWHAALAY